MIGVLVLWHPAMMACMDSMHGMDGMAGMPGMDHTAQHHGIPRNTGRHDCCGVCACTITVSIPPTPSTSLRVAVQVVYPTVDRALSAPVVATPHDLPFPIGPPPLLA